MLSIPTIGLCRSGGPETQKLIYSYQWTWQEYHYIISYSCHQDTLFTRTPYVWGPADKNGSYCTNRVSDSEWQEKVGLLLHSGEEKNTCETQVFQLGTSWYSLTPLTRYMQQLRPEEGMIIQHLNSQE